MERQRKERLVGAAVLIMLAVIFIPMVLDDSVHPEDGITGTNIPPKPEGEFESRVIPLPTAGNAGHGTGSEQVPLPAPVREPETPADPATVAEDLKAEAVPASGSTPATVTPAASTPSSPEAAGTNDPAKGAATATGKTPSNSVGATAWVVQLGSFASAENAEALNKKLRQAGYSAFVEPLQQDGAKVFKVRVGPELRRSGAQSVRDRLKANLGLDGIVVPYP